MTAPHSLSLEYQKAALRARMLQQRSVRVDALCSVAVRERLLRVVSRLVGKTIGAVWPLGDELDLRPLFPELIACGCKVALPETPPKGQPLIFRQWCADTEMKVGRFRTLHPDGAVITPDIVLVPLLAFDRRGFRLGYGGGYYDRTLAQLRIPAFGFGAAWQEVPVVPTGPYDHPLDAIVTDQGVIRPRMYGKA